MSVYGPFLVLIVVEVYVFLKATQDLLTIVLISLLFSLHSGILLMYSAVVLDTLCNLPTGIGGASLKASKTEHMVLLDSEGDVVMSDAASAFHTSSNNTIRRIKNEQHKHLPLLLDRFKNLIEGCNLNSTGAQKALSRKKARLTKIKRPKNTNIHVTDAMNPRIPKQALTRHPSRVYIKLRKEWGEIQHMAQLLSYSLLEATQEFDRNEVNFMMELVQSNGFHKNRYDSDSGVSDSDDDDDSSRGTRATQEEEDLYARYYLEKEIRGRKFTRLQKRVERMIALFLTPEYEVPGTLIPVKMGTASWSLMYVGVASMQIMTVRNMVNNADANVLNFVNLIYELLSPVDCTNKMRSTPLFSLTQALGHGGYVPASICPRLTNTNGEKVNDQKEIQDQKVRESFFLLRLYTCMYVLLVY